MTRVFCVELVLLMEDPYFQCFPYAKVLTPTPDVLPIHFVDVETR